MEHNTDRILWTVLILAIGVALYVGFRPAANGLLHQVVDKTQAVMTSVNSNPSDNSNSSSSSSSSSSTNPAVGTNLFSQSTATAGYIDGVTGNVDPAAPSNEIVSDYIPVSANSNYTFQMWGTTPKNQANWYGIGLYDSNKKFISRQGGYGSGQTSDTVEHVSKNLTTTSATAYVRVSFSKYNDYKAKLEKGSVATPYTP